MPPDGFSQTLPAYLFALLFVTTLAACDQSLGSDAPATTLTDQTPPNLLEPAELPLGIDPALFQLPPADGPLRRAAVELYNDWYLASEPPEDHVRWVGGSVESCIPGTVPTETRALMLRRLMYYRKATGLHHTIPQDTERSQEVQAAALIMTANGGVANHYPTDSWNCFSEEGRKGAGSSLIAASPSSWGVDSKIRDHGSFNIAVAHRRILLDPGLSSVSIGNTSDNAVIGYSAEARPLGHPRATPRRTWSEKTVGPLRSTTWTSITHRSRCTTALASQLNFGGRPSVVLRDTQFGSRRITHGKSPKTPSMSSKLRTPNIKSKMTSKPAISPTESSYSMRGL